MNIGLCDDEFAILEDMRRFVSEYCMQRHLSLTVYCFQSGEELLSAVMKGQALDVLFLDIYMGDSNGIEVARKIREYDKACRIVFSTNSKDHAIDGYGVRAFHYLLKPVAAADVASVLEEVMESLPEKADRYVQIVNKQGSYRILLGDVIFAESDARVLTVHTRKQGNISFYDRLDSFESLCGDARFLRCHKSFLVNLDYVNGIANNRFVLETGEEIRISMRVSEAKELFAIHMAEKI